MDSSGKGRNGSVTDDNTSSAPNSDSESFEIPSGLLESDNSDCASFISAVSHSERGISNVPAVTKTVKEGDFISSIPEELIIHIFCLCKPNNRFTRPVSTQMPMVLCRVSKLWREIAIRTTALWTSLSLRPLSNTPGANLFRVLGKPLIHPILAPPLTQLWLNRSGSRSLSLDIGSSFEAEAALPYIDRARDIIIHPSSEFMEKFIRTVYGFAFQTLRLEHITVSCVSESILLGAFNILGDFPNLRSLDIGDINAQYPYGTFSWLQNITRLTLYGGKYDMRRQMEIIRQCIGLEHFEFIHAGDEGFNGNVITLRRLRSLSVVDGKCFDIIFPHFRSPALESVSLSGESCVFRTLDNFRSFEGLCERSGCTLELLSVDVKIPNYVEAQQVYRFFTTTNINFVQYLTSLNLRLDAEIGLHMEIVGLCTSLLRLKLATHGGEDANRRGEIQVPTPPLQFAPFPHVTLPSLTSLDLVGKGLDAVVIPNFTLPVLERLCMSSTLKKPEDFVDFIGFCKRSSFQLEFLSLSIGPHRGDDLTSLIQGSSYLIQLETLELSGITDDFLRILKYPDTGEPNVYVLPCLRYLALANFNVTDGLIARMASSRWKSDWACNQPLPNTNLRSITIQGPLEKVDQYYLDRLEADGLSVIRT
ncbi:hypothetical protein BDZ94DRAFT_1326592 [Collybia nuda]|uniref:F-box domain-containing protein n=1 Tax=Collybia nuda TaxID=64659 RepID=A0A9P6CDD8_9AGAR|nr:hypothetical protein BDZ94DRAFT_1326592 [Collybia nuda]